MSIFTSFLLHVTIKTFHKLTTLALIQVCIEVCKVNSKFTPHTISRTRPKRCWFTKNRTGL